MAYLYFSFVNFLALFALCFASFAQDDNGLSSQKWAKICVQSGEVKNCNVRHTTYTQQGQLVVGVNLALRTRDADPDFKQQIFQLVVPSWRLIPAGILMSIDDEQPKRLPYNVCLPNRCLSEILLSDELIAKMKAGANMNIVSHNFRNKENKTVVSLSGFTAAWEGPPLSPEQISAEKQQLQKQLQEKEQEVRRKLIEAQDKAKAESGG